MKTDIEKMNRTWDHLLVARTAGGLFVARKNAAKIYFGILVSMSFPANCTNCYPFYVL